ncbi:peptidase [Streptomyces viridochromogenes]|uniref:Peptidase n=1 Tax=Streptomyces viridochromogenes TaxID=1938 RepID=A0A0J8BRZ4_STRVR|nr:Clp protease N-terminal domain-containing protein [Streptomyces viridochromogenes]KMS68380.1 peptidase [Streptomyces viridochromogenes]KOG08019.1 peptidase [Streptomyces viridochromogenes]KOG08168.1 peptidase [Streptomyces viridochromogenes]
MQRRIPRQSAKEQDCRHPAAADDARLSDELAAVVSGARRRAVRDGDRQIDTAHLLHSLLEHDRDVYAVFGDGPQIARLLGYLVQRTIGYGLRWQGAVEDSGAVPVVRDGEGYSPLAASAMEDACRRAARRGDARAGGIDLLAAIVADPQARAVEVLARAGIDANELLARIDARSGERRDERRDEWRDEYAADGETAR